MDLDPEHPEFPVDTRSAPGRVGLGHFQNQPAGTRSNLRSSGPAPRSGPPEKPESLAVPPNHSLSGLTRISALFQSCHILERITQKIRSRVRIAGRLVCRLRMASCWRRARFSTARCRSSARMSIRKGKISVSMVPGSVRPSVSTVNNVKQDEQTLGAGEAQRGSGPDVPRIKEAGQGPAFGV